MLPPNFARALAKGTVCHVFFFFLMMKNVQRPNLERIGSGGGGGGTRYDRMNIQLAPLK